MTHPRFWHFSLCGAPKTPVHKELLRDTAIDVAPSPLVTAKTLAFGQRVASI